MRSTGTVRVIALLMLESLVAGCAASQRAPEKVEQGKVEREAWLVEVRLGSGGELGPPQQFTVEGDVGTRQCGNTEVLEICRVGGDFETPIFDIHMPRDEPSPRSHFAVRLGWRAKIVVEPTDSRMSIALEILEGRRARTL